MLNLAQEWFLWIVHNVVPFVVLITPVVFFHELGHFLVARAFRVNVETFSIGFGPAIFGWRDRAGTQWKISWIPLGGYVKFLGDMNATGMPDKDRLEHLPANERAGAFSFKPLYQRALVVVAGPAANFVLAIVVLAGFLLAFGTLVAAPVVSQVVPTSAAATAGFKAGDTIVSVDGASIDSFDKIRIAIWDRAGQTLAIVVRRGGKELTLHAKPGPTAIKIMGQTQTVGHLGIAGPPAGQWKAVHYGPIGALAEASRETWDIVATTMDYIGRMLSGGASPSQLNGPIGIAKISAAVASVSYLSLFRLAALISISVGLINLFPIPILDGGHLLYYGFEAVLGRPLGARAQDVGFRLGLAVMLGLLLLATFNDLHLSHF
ncbi:MAG TPA: RIP metalloprotease RseP [Rhizomicrobium sp.]